MLPAAGGLGTGPSCSGPKSRRSGQSYGSAWMPVWFAQPSTLFWMAIGRSLAVVSGCQLGTGSIIDGTSGQSACWATPSPPRRCRRKRRTRCGTGRALNPPAPAPLDGPTPTSPLDGPTPTSEPPMPVPTSEPPKPVAHAAAEAASPFSAETVDATAVSGGARVWSRPPPATSRPASTQQAALRAVTAHVATNPQSASRLPSPPYAPGVNPERHAARLPKQGARTCQGPVRRTV